MVMSLSETSRILEKILRLPLQEGRFSPLRRISSRHEPQPLATHDSETVYSVCKLPDGFRAVFDHGVFNHGDVSKLTDFHRERYSGKELRLVPLSELDGEASHHNKSTGVSTPFTPTEPVYVLLVEDKEIPDGDSSAKAIYFLTQAMKEESCPDKV